MTRVYLDHNATTPLRPEVRALLVETLEQVGGNPSSAHGSGRAARAIVDAARERTARALGVGEDEILFTSGGTEANNLALLGAVRAAGPDAGLAIPATEHPSILGPAEALRAEGRRVELARVDARGRVDLQEIERMAEWAAVLSVAAANGEVGTLGPLAGLAARGVTSARTVHTDAVQALGRIPLCLRGWGVALASFSAHKVGGPPGVGVLYRRADVRLAPIATGGGQESELRPGTENVAGIAAAALAFELACAEQQEFAERSRVLTSTLWHELRRALPEACLLGPALDDEDRLPNTLDVSIPDVDGRVFVARLDLEGLEASSGSACASGSVEPSHVLLAMGFDRERARGGLRLSLGRTTTTRDVHKAVEILSRTVANARRN